MALNFSHSPIYPAHLSEDNLVSPIRIADGYFVEGIIDNSGDGFARSWNSCRVVEDCFVYGSDRVEMCRSHESIDDILDRLPSDPFGMDISSTFTAITGWLEDLVADCNECGSNNFNTDDSDIEVFAGFNFIWNNAFKIQAFHWNSGFLDGFDAYRMEMHRRNENDMESCSNVDVGYPHAALSFMLSHLDVKDLLSVERVCKSLCQTVRTDTLLWMNIYIDYPLNVKITDDALLGLTDRAQGNLQSLSLIDCIRITNTGLRRVTESNPRIAKLVVPGCVKLSIEGVINSLKAIRIVNTPVIKVLRIGGIYGASETHFEELKSLLGIDSQSNSNNPHLYYGRKLELSWDDNPVIDIQVCPRCKNFRLVYDCTAKGCQEKENTTAHACRACILCIQRCIQCGRCITDDEYEETFSFERICMGCWNQMIDL